MRRRILPAIVAVAVLAGGCTFAEPKPPPRTSVSESIPAPPDSGLRPVTTPYGDGIAYVRPEIAAQAICQALSLKEWRDVIGTDVGRVVDVKGFPACVVDSGALKVRLVMTSEPITDVAAETETIAGHRARVEVRATLGDAAAEVVPTVGGTYQNGFNPVLLIGVTAEGRVDFGELLRAVLAALLPKLAHDGPKTPVADTEGWLKYTPTPPIPGAPLSDLPMTARALVECTAVANSTEPKPSPDRVEVHASGHCAWSEPESVLAGFSMSGTTALGQTKLTVAGHPARLEDGTLTIELGVARDQSWPIHLRLTRKGLGEAALLAWAERIVPAIGKV